MDLAAEEVRKSGLRQKLPAQHFQVLRVLLERPQEVVTREELRQRIWPDNTFVDYDLALKKAVNRLRDVLGDSAESPRFIETIPRRGYRFIGAISARSILQDSSASPITAPTDRLEETDLRTGAPFSWKLIATFSLAVIAALLLWLNADTLRTRIFAHPRAAEIRSIAVLPLQNLSNDPEQEYFSDGMTDELITDLAKVSRLQVISHTSVQRYKGTKLTLPRIAHELAVDAVVEGQVMRAGDRVRITAQLIDARTDRHLWAQSYERSLKDVLSLQAEVAQRIAAQIGVRLTGGEQTRIVAAGEVDSAAHEAFLKGIFYWSQSNCDGSKKGLKYFQEAVDKDPRFAPAHVGVAQSYFTLGDWGCSSPDEVFPMSKAAALKAIELDPKLSSAHAWLGMLAAFHEWDWTSAESELRSAIELDPNYVPARLGYAVFLIDMGRRDESLTEMKKARELDPTSELTNMVAVHVFYLARDYDRAIEQARATLELHPESWGTYVWLGASYEMKGMYQQAVDAYLKSKILYRVASFQTESTGLDAFQKAYLKSGMRGYWQQELIIANQDGASCSVANQYAHLGQKDKALQHLTQAVDRHCDELRMLKADPVYDSLRGDHRFQEILHRLNFPQ